MQKCAEQSILTRIIFFGMNALRSKAGGQRKPFWYWVWQSSHLMIGPNEKNWLKMVRRHIIHNLGTCIPANAPCVPLSCPPLFSPNHEWNKDFSIQYPALNWYYHVCPNQNRGNRYSWVPYLNSFSAGLPLMLPGSFIRLAHIARYKGARSTSDTQST